MIEQTFQSFLSPSHHHVASTGFDVAATHESYDTFVLVEKDANEWTAVLQQRPPSDSAEANRSKTIYVPKRIAFYND